MMGVDDPSRNFKGVHPVRPEKEERMRQLVRHSRTEGGLPEIRGSERFVVQYKEMIALEKAGAEVAIDSIIVRLLLFPPQVGY